MNWLGIGDLPITVQIVILIVYVVGILAGIYGIAELIKTSKEK